MGLTSSPDQNLQQPAIRHENSVATWRGSRNKNETLRTGIRTLMADGGQNIQSVGGVVIRGTVKQKAKKNVARRR